MILPENTTLWPEAIVEALVERFPEIEELGANVKVLENNETNRNMTTIITIPSTDIGIFGVVKKGEITPFNLAVKGDKIVPLNKDRLNDLLIDLEFGDKAVDGPSKNGVIQNQSFYDVQNENGDSLGRTITDPSFGSGIMGGDMLFGVGNEKVASTSEIKTIKIASSIFNYSKERFEKTKKIKRASLRDVDRDAFVEENIMKNFDFDNQVKLAAAMHYSIGSEIYPVSEKIASAKYDSKQDKILYKKAALEKEKVGGGLILRIKFVDKETLGEDPLEGDEERKRTLLLNPDKEMPVGHCKIRRIVERKFFENPEIKTPCGVGVKDADDETFLPGIIRHLFDISSLNPFNKRHKMMRGMRFLGMTERNTPVVSDLEDGIKTMMNSKMEGVLDALKGGILTPGKTFVLVTPKEISSNLKFLKSENGEVEAETEENDIIKIKKDDKIKEASFFNDVLYMPKNTVYVQVDEKTKVAGIKETAVEVPTLTELWEKEKEKKASSKARVVIFVEKHDAGYTVYSIYRDTTEMFTEKVFSSSATDVGDELISIGVRPMKAKTIARNLEASPPTAFSIDIDVDETREKMASFILEDEEMENLIKVAYDKGIEEQDFGEMMSGIGMSVIDKDQTKKYEELLPEIKKVKDELGEFALMKKMFGEEETVDQTIKAIESLNKVERYI